MNVTVGEAVLVAVVDETTVDLVALVDVTDVDPPRAISQFSQPNYSSGITRKTLIVIAILLLTIRSRNAGTCT